MLGLESGDATPNPEVSKAEDEKAKAVIRQAIVRLGTLERASRR